MDHDIPSSVYRLQLGKNFPLRKAIALLPFLYELGVEGIYCSPIFACSSDNGYEVTDPNQLNPSLGSLQDYEEFCRQIQRYGMKQILDIVPNHMSMRGGKNRWWSDVMEKGRASFFAQFFDFYWKPHEEKIVFPILNETYEKTLKNFKILWDDGYWVCYDDFRFPCAKTSYSLIEKTFPQFTPEEMHQILDLQHYRLVHWSYAEKEMDYRRFFNLNHLIGLHIENQHAFQEYHRRVFQLLEQNKIQGLRIDHIEGLYNPLQYLKRLKTKKIPLLLVEKILMPKEKLPDTWPVDGTVGYEYLNLVNGLFIEKKNERAFNQAYEKFLSKRLSIEKILHDCRKRYVQQNMKGDIEFLARKLGQLIPYCFHDLVHALEHLLICFPVYRTYLLTASSMTKSDQISLQSTLAQAKRKAPKKDLPLYRELQKLFFSKKNEPRARDFILSFQQFTPSIMAKGLEDSTFYLYNRFIALNEVGGSPKIFGSTIQDFHRFNQEKLSKHPFGLLASSTHDTKFSEDVRLRLATLSEMPKQWKLLVEKWKKHNQKYKTRLNGSLFPDLNTEYYLYQMLLGVWPCSRKRLWPIFQKILREAGIYTSWRTTNTLYEKAAKNFLHSLLQPNKQNLFLPSFLKFHKKISPYGYWNSLSALVLKIGSCGIADFYQGEEEWDFCLVDPDNRQPIPYELRKSDLKLWITQKALNVRKQYKELFLLGDYIPLKIRNEKKKHLIAFMRRYETKTAIVIAARHLSSLLPDRSIRFPCKRDVWGASEILLPKLPAVQEVQDVFTGTTHQIKHALPMSQILHRFPFAILIPCSGQTGRGKPG